MQSCMQKKNAGAIHIKDTKAANNKTSTNQENTKQKRGAIEHLKLNKPIRKKIRKKLKTNNDSRK